MNYKGFKVLSFALALLIIAQCSRTMKFVDTKVTEGPHDFLTSAPIVVIGTIVSESPAAEPVASHWNSEYRVQLQRISIDVENVLKGDLELGKHDVYAFYNASSYTGPRTLGWWNYSKSTKRKLFYLRRESSALRTTCDVISYCVKEVASGKHANLKQPDDRPLEQKLAQLLFTKGTDVTDEELLDGLERSANLVPHKYSRPYLVELTKTLNVELRKDACYILREMIEFKEADIPKDCEQQIK